MAVSVIIPFYNSNEHLVRAIKSARQQEEVSEIILVDDGSIDESLSLAKAQGKKDKRIIVVEHKVNKGRSAARNTGLSMASCEFISFLDADDYFLKNRYYEVQDILNADTTIGGIYEPIGTEYKSDEVDKEVYPISTGLSKVIDSGQLFDCLIRGEDGHISLIGCTFRTNSIRPFSFDINLSIGEDTDFIWRVARVIKLLPGAKQIRVVRSVTAESSLLMEEALIKNRALFYKKWLPEAWNKKLSKKAAKKILKSYAYYAAMNKGKTGFFLQWTQLNFLLKVILKRPTLVRLIF